MAIDLQTLLPSLAGWRPDFEASDEAQLFIALQRAARLVATETLALREFVEILAQPASAIVTPYADESPKTCLQVLGIHTIPGDETPVAWLREVPPHAISNIKNPDLLPLADPTCFTPIEGGAILNSRPMSNPDLKVLVAFTLQEDTDVWPFPGGCEMAITNLALSFLMEKPGKHQDRNVAREKAILGRRGIANIKAASAMGMASGDYRVHVQLPPAPSRPVPTTGGGSNGDGGGLA